MDSAGQRRSGARMFVAACGSRAAAAEPSEASRPISGTRPALSSQGKEGGNAHLPRRRRRRLPRSGPDYYTFGYMVQNAVNRTLYSYKPDNSIDAGARTSPTGAPQISADKKTITVKIQQGRQVRAAGQPRGQDRRTSSTPSSARSPRTSRAATPTRTSSRSSARRKPASGPIKPISGIQTPDDHTIMFKLKSRRRRWSRRRS